MVRKFGFGVTSYSPLGGGFLTGRYTKDSQPESKRAESTKARYYKERNFKIVDELKDIAATKDAAIAQVALAWVLTKESITAPIIGVNSIEQLEENLGALDITLSDNELDRLNTVSDWTELDYLAR